MSEQVRSRRARLIGGAVALAIVGFAPSANAATVSVCASGCDHSSVAAAVAAAAPGDTVSIAAGTYSEPTSILVDKALTIDGTGIGATIIDGGGTSVGATGQLHIESDVGEDVTVSDLTIRRPVKGSTTAGIFAKSTDSPGPDYVFDHVAIEGNGSGEEYGIWTENSTANVTFQNGSISGTQYNPILFEEPRGATSVISNDIARGVCCGMFVMKTNPNGTGLDTTAPQRVQDNEFTGGAGVSFVADFSTNGSGGFTDIEISGNSFEAAGITLRNQGTTNSPITGALIENNRLTGSGAGVGIALTGLVPGTDIIGNTIRAFAAGVSATAGAGGLKPTGAEVHANRIVGNVTAGVSATTPVDAEENWWGCPGGPAVAGCDKTDGPVDADPWIVPALIAPTWVTWPAAVELKTSLERLSSGALASNPAAFPDMEIPFGSTAGSVVSPRTLLDSVATTTFTPPAINGPVTVSTVVDSWAYFFTLGVTGVPLRPTKLTAKALLVETKPLSLPLGTASATLTDTGTGAALPGRLIVFKSGSTELCRATTNATGVASCRATLGGLLSAVLSLGYDARFAGDLNYAPAAAQGAGRGPLIGLGLLGL